MSRIRVNELARQLEVKSREVIDKLHELGIAQRVTHSSLISEDQANQLRRFYAGESIESTQTTDSRRFAAVAPVINESVIGASESGVEIYIDAAVSIGKPNASSWVDHSAGWRNQHAIWEHANQTISKPSPSQQDLSSAVIQLQRSVEHRDKLLDHLYSFEKIPGRSPGSKYETMAELRVIRPTLKTRLRDLRNRLMHEFHEIPLTVPDCEELADTAWYYLKATDHLAHQCISDFVLSSTLASGKQAYLTITFNRSDWTAWIIADVPDEALQSSATGKNMIIRATPSMVQKGDNRTRFSGTASGSARGR